MIQTEIAELRSSIEGALSKLDSLVQGAKLDLKESSEAGSTVFQDQLDCAKAEVDLSTISVIHNQSVRHQNRLLSALTRLNSGTMDTCITCQDEIGLERLRAYPAALRCIDCEEFIETGFYPANLIFPETLKNQSGWLPV